MASPPRPPTLPRSDHPITTTTTPKSRKRSSSESAASPSPSPPQPSRSTAASPAPVPASLTAPAPAPAPEHDQSQAQHPPAAKRLRRSSSFSPASSPASSPRSRSHSPPSAVSIESGARLARRHSLILKHLALAHKLLFLAQAGYDACEEQLETLLTSPGALLTPFDDDPTRYIDPALDLDTDATTDIKLPRNVFMIACALIVTCLDLLDPSDTVIIPLSITLAKLLLQVTMALCDLYTDDGIVTDANIYEGLDPAHPQLARQELHACRVSLYVMDQATEVIARAAWPVRGEGAAVWFDLGVVKCLQVEGMVAVEERVKVAAVEGELVDAMAWLERGIMGTASPQLLIQRIVQAVDRVRSINSRFDCYVNKNPSKAHIYLTDPDPITTTLLHSLLALIHHAWYSSRDLAANSPQLMSAWSTVLRDLAANTGSMSYAHQSVQRALIALTRTLRPASISETDQDDEDDEDEKFATELVRRRLLVFSCLSLIHTLTHADDDTTLVDTSPPPLADRMDEVVATCAIAHTQLCWMLDADRRTRVPGRVFNWARKVVKQVVDEWDAARFKAGTKGKGGMRLVVPDAAIGVVKKPRKETRREVPRVVVHEEEVADEDLEMDVDVVDPENVPVGEAKAESTTATGDAMDVDPALVSVIHGGGGTQENDEDEDDEEDDSDFDPDKQSDADEDGMDVDSSDEDDEDDEDDFQFRMIEMAEMLAAQAEAGDPELLALLAVKKAEADAEQARALVEAKMDEEKEEEDQLQQDE